MSFGSLLGMTLSVMPAILVGLLALATVGVAAQDRGLARGLKWAIALVPVVPTALLGIGAAFAAVPGHPSPNVIAESALALVALVGALGFAASYAQARSQRFAVIAVCALGGWLTFWSYFVAIMSVTGDWL